MKKARKYDIEVGFLSKLVETKDMKMLKDLQIKPSFLTGDNKRVFLYISSAFRDNGEVPTPRVLSQKFPSYELEVHEVDGDKQVGTDEALSFWCDELRTKAKHNRMAEATEEFADMLDKGDVEDAYNHMKEAVWKIESELVISESVDITKSTEDRKTSYLERKKDKGMIGIPTGISHLDYSMKGLINETLTTIIANTGIGKTWFLILIACYSMLNNFRVLMFVTEMSTDLMQDRFDAMLFGMIRGDFNYSKFKSGALDPETEASYFEFLEEELPRLEPLIIETAIGVSSITSAIEEYHPDLVLIDGAYLMEDEEGAKDDWLRVTHITRALKKISKNRHLPIVINTQADKNTSKKTGPELGSIMYTQAIGQDSDNVLALFRDDIMAEDNEMGVKILKQREGSLGRAIINWDFNHMNFKSIYSERDGGTEEEDDEDNAESKELEEMQSSKFMEE